MLGLFEALGETQQTLIGFTEFFKVRSRPFALLQALPYLQDLTGLVNDALGEMVLETVSARIFWFGHVLTTYRGNPDTNAGAMLALLFPRKCAVSHFVVIFFTPFRVKFPSFQARSVPGWTGNKRRVPLDTAFRHRGKDEGFRISKLQPESLGSALPRPLGRAGLGKADSAQATFDFLPPAPLAGRLQQTRHVSQTDPRLILPMHHARRTVLPFQQRRHRGVAERRNRALMEHGQDLIRQPFANGVVGSVA